MCDCQGTNRNNMSKEREVSKNTGTEKIFSDRPEHLLALMQKCCELQLAVKDTKKDFEKVIKMLGVLKSNTLKNKYKKSLQIGVVNINQEEVQPSCNNNDKHRRDSDESISSIDGINDTILMTNKYEKVLVFDEARALSKTDHHSNNPDKNRNKRPLTNTTEYSDKSDNSDNKKARTSSTAIENSNISGSLNNDKVLVLSNTTDHSNKSESATNKQALTLSNVHDDSAKSDSQSNKKVLVLSNTNNHSKNSDNPSKTKALASLNTTDNVDESAGPSTKEAVASSNATDHSDETSDKENQTSDNTSQSNERIPPPVAAPVAEEEEEEEDDEGHAELVPIGSGRTLIRRDRYRAVYWKSYNYATRTLLRGVFSREVLATHTLSGKWSPASPDRPALPCLDEQKVSDIIIEVKKRFEVNENIIRKIIARKCSDEREWRKTIQMEEGKDE